MATQVSQIMTSDPQMIESDRSIVDAARLMREHDIGSLIVTKPEGGLCGIVTDRDLVIRVLAEESDASETPVDQACSHTLHTVSPTDSAAKAVALMREHAIRRIPVLEDGRPVGIVSLGDLAVDRDPDSALAEISAESPNE